MWAPGMSFRGLKPMATVVLSLREARLPGNPDALTGG